MMYGTIAAKESVRPKLDSLTRKIQDTITDIAGSFIYIGFLLWEARDEKYYLEGGYCDIVEYAEKELNFKKSSTYNFINICLRFSQRVDGTNRPSYQITNTYKKFSYSQLCEMLSLSERQCQQVEPTMTVKQIREVKKTVNVEVSTADVVPVSVQTSGIHAIELKSCPFCGGAAEYQQFANPKYFYNVRCTVCGCHTDGFVLSTSSSANDNKKRNADVWNCRV
jgi:hypothetical protein